MKKLDAFCGFSIPYRPIIIEIDGTALLENIKSCKVPVRRKETVKEKCLRRSVCHQYKEEILNLYVKI